MKNLEVAFYKNDINEIVKNFLESEDNSIEFYKNFLKGLHKEDINKLFNKTLHLKVEDVKDMWGIFDFNLDFFDDDEQEIIINPNINFKNEKFRKILFFSTYLHETTHEKQRDFFNYNNENNIKEISDYNKLLNLEIFCKLDVKLCNYEQRLIEIDAIYNNIKRFKKFLDNNTITKNEEAIMIQLFNCVRYFASINLNKHHTYCPENFNVKSTKLINYYKKFYEDLEINYSYKPLSYLIKNSCLFDLKINELLNINFNEVEKEIDKKTEFVYNELKNNLFEILRFYKPSKEIKKYLNVNNLKDWENALMQNNLVKLSALICDDLKSKYTGFDFRILNNKEEENALIN